MVDGERKKRLNASESRGFVSKKANAAAALREDATKTTEDRKFERSCRFFQQIAFANLSIAHAGSSARRPPLHLGRSEGGAKEPRTPNVNETSSPYTTEPTASSPSKTFPRTSTKNSLDTGNPSYPQRELNIKASRSQESCRRGSRCRGT